jgi:hypothetical protein
MTLAPLPANKRKRHFFSEHELIDKELEDHNEEDAEE